MSHRFLFDVLEAFGFGPGFRSWVRLLYTDVLSRILVNGNVSAAVQVRRSVRQGCGLSPLLYVLSVEPFARKVRGSSRVSGLQIPGSMDRVKTIQYAYDLSVLVRTEAEVREVLAVAELFHRASGALLNKEKSWGIWLGGLKGCYNHCFGINFTCEALKCLGVLFSRSGGDLPDFNWDPLVRKLEGVLRDWKGRWLNFRGKASAMNVGALSKLWHVGHIVLMHPKHIKRLKSTVFDFLWQGPDRVKRSVMVASHLAGGVGLSEVELRLQSFSVVHIYKLLFAEARPKWMHFAAYFVGFHLRRWRASFASNLVPHADQVTPFYVFAFRQWQRFVEACPNWRVGVVDSRRVYGVLLDLFPERTPRVELLRENGLVSFPECWRNVACSFVDPEVRDLSWRVSHSILPMNLTLFRQGQYPSDRCPLCSEAIESVDHLFLQCSVVGPVIVFLERVLGRLLNRAVVVDTHFLLFNNLGRLGQMERDLVLLLTGHFKAAVWSAWNLRKKERKCIAAADIRRLWLGALYRRFCVDRVRLSDTGLGGVWALRGVVVERIGGEWGFVLGDGQGG